MRSDSDLSTRQVPMPSDWAIAIIQSGVTRGLVDGHYNARRRDCETAAAALGLSSLRDADLPMIAAAKLDPTIAAVSAVQILLLGIIMLVTDRFVKLSQVV